MQLTKELSLHRINGNSHNIIEKEYEYMFRYKNFLAELTVALEIKAYTKELMLPVMNFGYGLTINKWNPREQYFASVFEHNDNDGRSTRRYIDNREDRRIIFGFVKKRLRHYLNSTKPPILIRGPLSLECIKLPRYQEIDALLLDFGYIKKETPCMDLKMLHSSYPKRLRDENGVFLIYTLSHEFQNSLEDLITK